MTCRWCKNQKEGHWDEGSCPECGLFGRSNNDALIEFKTGDKVYTWSLTVYGAYCPYFSDYTIMNIIKQGTITWVNLSHENQVDLMIPINFVYTTKNKAIDAMIRMMQELKDIPLSSCCSVHSGTTDECKDPCEHESDGIKHVMNDDGKIFSLCKCVHCGEFYK